MAALSFVALELQTTRLDPASVSRASYVKLVDGNITRVDAWPILPPTAGEGDNTESDDGDTRTWQQALSQLNRVIGQLPIVSYYRDADKEVFQAASRYIDETAPDFHWLDCRALVHTLVPDLAEYQLSTVLKELGLFDEYGDSNVVQQTTHIVLELAKRENAQTVQELWGSLYDQPDQMLGLHTDVNTVVESDDTDQHSEDPSARPAFLAEPSVSESSIKSEPPQEVSGSDLGAELANANEAAPTEAQEHDQDTITDGTKELSEEVAADETTEDTDAAELADDQLKQAEGESADGRPPQELPTFLADPETTDPAYGQEVPAFLAESDATETAAEHSEDEATTSWAEETDTAARDTHDSEGDEIAQGSSTDHGEFETDPVRLELEASPERVDVPVTVSVQPTSDEETEGSNNDKRVRGQTVNTKNPPSSTIRLFGFIGVFVFGLLTVVGLVLTVMAVMLFFTENTLMLETKIAGVVLTGAITLLSALMTTISYRGCRKNS